MQIYEGERLDYVNDDITLIQRTSGLTFGTDALLLAGYVSGKYEKGAELGGGTGIISMLLLTRNKLKTSECYEVQKEYAELIRRNAEYNGLSERLFSNNTDIRDLPQSGTFDLVFTNPPYMRADSGRANLESEKNIARHEVHGDISDFCRISSGLLKFGGAFYAVYRPDRLPDLICAMREYKIEPKRITLVYADEKSEPSMMLVEGKRGGKSGCLTTRPLIIYRDKSHEKYTEDMEYIMNYGAFPQGFSKKNEGRRGD